MEKAVGMPSSWSDRSEDLLHSRSDPDRGELAVAFANLLARRGESSRDAILTDYKSFIGWCVEAGALGSGDAERIRADAEHRPDQTAAALERAGALAGALRRILEAVSRTRRPEPADLDHLNREWREAVSRSRLVARGRRFALELPPGGRSLVRPLWPIVRSAAALLTSPWLDRLRICAAQDCTHLFLDMSRNGSRRWCDMAVCGNRAKARRFYRRHRRESVTRDGP